MSSPKTILLADDDRMICEAIGEELRSKGYAVHIVHDGEAALGAARQLQPDVLILDIVMPKLTGAQVSRLVRQEPRLERVKIVALSAVGTLDFRWFSELSADFFVAKKTLPETCRNLLLAIELAGSKSRDAFGRRLLGGEPSGSRPSGAMIGVQPRLAGLLEPLGEACGRGLLELDRRGYILQATPLACEALGREEAALLGTALPALCGPGDHSLVEGLVEAAASTPGQRFSAVITAATRRIHVQLLGLRTDAMDALVAVVTRWDELPTPADQPTERQPVPGPEGPAAAAADTAAPEVARQGEAEPLREVSVERWVYRIRLSRVPDAAWIREFARVVDRTLAIRVEGDTLVFEADPRATDEWVRRLDAWTQSANSTVRAAKPPTRPAP